MTAGNGRNKWVSSESRAGPAERTLCNEGVNPGRRALIKVEGRLQGLVRVSVSGSSLEGPRSQGGPIQPVLAPPSGFGWWSVACDWNHHAPAREEPEKKKINPRAGVTICDDTSESSVQARTPKVADDRTRQRGNVRGPARRRSTPISGGENPVADLANLHNPHSELWRSQ